MIRWLPGILGIILLVALDSGCNRTFFISEKDYDSATNQVVDHLEGDPAAGVTPISRSVEAPPVVDYPNRKPRFLSLPEAIAIALENGTASGNGIGRYVEQSGLVDDTVVTINTLRGFNNFFDRVRVLALNPAIAYSNIEASLSRFDPKWTTAMGWNVVDTLQNGLASFQNGSFGTFNSSIVKPLASGGVANITFNTNYQDLANPPLIGTFKVNNPLYTVPLQIGVEQPLLQNFGVGINQLMNQIAPIQGVTMPLQAANFYNNSRTPLIQGPNFSGLPVQGILLARLSFDQARAEFERNINNLLLQTEIAYWRLYSAYGELYSFEEVLRLAHKAWRTAEANFAQGRSTVPPAQFHAIRGQFEEFRGFRFEALGKVLEAERNLRGIIGLPVEDGKRLVPVTAPTLAPYQPNWKAALDDALALRPELILARQNLKNAQFSLMIQKNFLKPDLRFVGQYSPTGFGTRLDGNGTLLDGNIPPTAYTNNAFNSLGLGQFVNWNAGLTLNVPLGFRLESAAYRSTRLALAQSYYFLHDQEQRVTRVVTLQYQKMNEHYRRIEVARAEWQGYARAVSNLWELYKGGTTSLAGGKGDLTALVLSLLQYQRSMAVAQIKEYTEIANYNGTLAYFEHAKGTIQQYDNVSIADGPLPKCIQLRAVEHERMRTRSLVLQERPLPVNPMVKPGMAAVNQPIPQSLDEPMPPPPSPDQIMPPAPDESLPRPRPLDQAPPPAGTEKTSAETTALPAGEKEEPLLSEPNPAAAPWEILPRTLLGTTLPEDEAEDSGSDVDPASAPSPLDGKAENPSNPETAPAEPSLPPAQAGAPNQIAPPTMPAQEPSMSGKTQ